MKVIKNRIKAISLGVAMIMCCNCNPILSFECSANTEAVTSETAEMNLTLVDDIDTAYSIISVLDKNDVWLSGNIDAETKNIIDDAKYLSLDKYLAVLDTNYKVTVNNTAYRMKINKYNEENQYIGYVDLCHGDIFTITSTTKYITISLYKYANRQVAESTAEEKLYDFENGLNFSISQISDISTIQFDSAILTSEVNIESLSNSGNYRQGWYKSWGGSYEVESSSLCTRNFYKVDANQYVININDSRIMISVSEYGASGAWIKYTSSITNGKSFVKQAATEYIAITVKSLKWGVDLRSLFDCGLRIDLATEQYIFDTPTIDFADADFADVNNWRQGYYLYETGDYVLNSNKICYKEFLIIDNQSYVVNLPSGYMRMNILELANDGTVVLNKDLQSGQKWEKSENTAKIAVSVTGNLKTFVFSDYVKFINEYSRFGLVRYEKYTHNTVMQDVTAGQMINNINVGWNLGNSLDSKSSSDKRPNNLSQELAWNNPYVTHDLITRVKQAGFNTIRIPVTWYYNTYEDETGHLKINEKWLDRVQDVVNYAVEDGFYVILNMHHEQPVIYAGVSEKEMSKVLRNASDMWKGIAERFKTYDEKLMFEAYNEVDNLELSWNFGKKAAIQMNELNRVFVDTVRESGGNNANRILIVPTLLDGTGTNFYDAFVMPKDTVDNKIIVQVHTYLKKYNHDIDQNFSLMAYFSRRINAPIIIGEFGTEKNYPIPGLRAKHASNFIARAAAYGIKCIWWDNGTNYSIFDRRDYILSDTEIINALISGAADGTAYRSSNEYIFNDYHENFVFKMPNLNTGALEDVNDPKKDPNKDYWWRTITTDIGGAGIPVTPGNVCSFNLKSDNLAVNIYLQRAVFYDADGNLIKIYDENGNRKYPIEIRDSGFTKYYICTVPEGAATLRVSINNPYNWTKAGGADYERYLESGDLELSICVNAHDIVPIHISKSQFEYGENTIVSDVINRISAKEVNANEYSNNFNIKISDGLKGAFVLAAYGESNKIVGIYTHDLRGESGTEKNIVFTINTTGKAYTYKAFLWESMNTLEPLMKQEYGYFDSL